MDDRSATENFFTQLRKVGLATEKGVAELKQDYDNNTKRCPSKAILKLSDLKKEAKDIKVDARGKMEHMQQTGQAFDEFMSLCGSLIAKQTAALQDVETYMQQYGYIPKVTEEPKDKEEEVTGLEATDNTTKGDAVCTPPPCSREVPDTSKTPKTPVMEHTRLQSYRMKAVPASNTNTAMYSVQPANRTHQIPQVFEHDGLFVTPSLMGDKNLPLQTPDAHQSGNGYVQYGEYGSPYPLWSPAMSDMPSHQKIPRLDLDSHVDLTSPEIQTPSMRRLAQMSNACIPDFQKLSEAVSEQMMGCSPATPTFQTPNLKSLLLKNKSSVHKPCPIPNPGIGVKNLVKSEPLEYSVKTPPISRIYTAETPKTPEMTCDLSKLRGIASTFSYEPTAFSSVSKNDNTIIRNGIPEPPKLSYLQSQSDTPKTPELTHNFQSFRGLSNAPVPKFESLAERLGQNLPSVTPPTPDMLTTRLDQLKAEHSSHKPKAMYGSVSSHGDLDSPQLLGTYNFKTKLTSKENVPPR